MIWALISPTFSLSKTETSFSPARIAERASMTQFGHSESVLRGQPSVGLVFCQDFRSGLSDHFGVNDGFGLYLLKNWITSNNPPEISAKPLSACLVILIPTFRFLSASIVVSSHIRPWGAYCNDRAFTSDIANPLPFRYLDHKSTKGQVFQSVSPWFTRCQRAQIGSPWRCLSWDEFLTRRMMEHSVRRVYADLSA